MNAFQWLNDLMVWLAKLLPRLTLIKRTHKGVLFLPKGKAVQKEPGLIVWWPIISELNLVDTTERTLHVNAIVTKNRAISAAIVYIVINPLKTLLTYKDYLVRLDNEIQSQIYLHTEDNEKIVENLNEIFRNNIDIKEFKIIDNTKVNPIKLFKEYFYGENRN